MHFICLGIRTTLLKCSKPLTVDLSPCHRKAVFFTVLLAVVGLLCQYKLPSLVGCHLEQKTTFEIFQEFSCNLRHSEWLETINNYICTIKLVIWLLNILGFKCGHMGDFPKLGHI